MNTSTPSLQQQLLARVAQFQKTFPNITKAEIAHHCGIGESNFSAALAGRRGLSANSCLKLHTLLNLPRNEVIKKFSQPVRSSKILNFQQSVQGQPARMRLDNSGWTPGTGNSGQGQDPSIGSGMDTVADADTSMDAEALVATLRQVRSLHRKAICAINQYIVQSKVSDGSQTSNTGQRFGTRNIQKTLRFSSDDSTAATVNLVSVLGALDLTTRQTVIAAILRAFPH